jgi:hypothetical protein
LDNRALSSITEKLLYHTTTQGPIPGLDSIAVANNVSGRFRDALATRIL